MSIWWLALKDLLLIGRDKKAFLTLIMMPLLLIAILGAAFGDMFEGEGDVPIKKFTLGVVNLDAGPLGKVLSDEVFAKGLEEQINIKYFQQEEMKAQIKDHKISVGIVIGSDFSTSLMSGEEAQIKLISIPNPGIKSIIVKSVIEQFTQTIAIETEAAKLAQQKASQNGNNLVANQGATPEINQQELEKHISPLSFINEKTVKPDSEPVAAFQYYAAAMGVMFLLMTIVEGVSAMILEKEQEVYKRLLVSKLTYTNYLSGKMLGLIIIGLIQAFVIITGTNLIFGVSWGESVAGVVMMTVAFVISACGLGVLVGSFIKKEKTFSVAATLGTQIMAALGGSMAPLYIFPDWAVVAAKFLPNGLALQTYIELMSGASVSEIFPEVAAVLGLGIVFFAIGLGRLAIERRGSYA